MWSLNCAEVCRHKNLLHIDVQTHKGVEARKRGDALAQMRENAVARVHADLELDAPLSECAKGHNCERLRHGGIES